jgi:hypothetical protein
MIIGVSRERLDATDSFDRNRFGRAARLGGVDWSGRQGAPTPASPAPAQTQASKPPSAAGGVTVRMGGRMTAGFGAVSDSGRTR